MELKVKNVSILSCRLVIDKSFNNVVVVAKTFKNLEGPMCPIQWYLDIFLLKIIINSFSNVHNHRNV